MCLCIYVYVDVNVCKICGCAVGCVCKSHMIALMSVYLNGYENIVNMSICMYNTKAKHGPHKIRTNRGESWQATFSLKHINFILPQFDTIHIPGLHG